jgi:hypothetical protein
MSQRFAFNHTRAITPRIEVENLWRAGSSKTSRDVEGRRGTSRGVAVRGWRESAAEHGFVVHHEMDHVENDFLSDLAIRADHTLVAPVG